MIPDYCVYCHIKTNAKTFFRHDYEDYLCSDHEGRVVVPDARDLLYIDDGIDLQAEDDLVSQEMDEQAAQDGMGLGYNRSAIKKLDKRRRKLKLLRG